MDITTGPEQRRIEVIYRSDGVPMSVEMVQFDEPVELVDYRHIEISDPISLFYDYSTGEDEVSAREMTEEILDVMQGILQLPCIPYAEAETAKAMDAKHEELRQIRNRMRDAGQTEDYLALGRNMMKSNKFLVVKQFGALQDIAQENISEGNSSETEENRQLITDISHLAEIGNEVLSGINNIDATERITRVHLVRALTARALWVASGKPLSEFGKGEGEDDLLERETERFGSKNFEDIVREYLPKTAD